MLRNEKKKKKKGKEKLEEIKSWFDFQKTGVRSQKNHRLDKAKRCG